VVSVVSVIDLGKLRSFSALYTREHEDFSLSFAMRIGAQNAKRIRSLRALILFLWTRSARKNRQINCGKSRDGVDCCEAILNIYASALFVNDA